MQIGLIRSAWHPRQFDRSFTDAVEECVEFHDGSRLARNVTESMLRLATQSFVAPGEGWTVNPQAQRRQRRVDSLRKNAPHSAAIPNALETYLAAFSKPTDHLSSRGEPCPRGFQRSHKPDVKIPPEPLRCMTSVMPENG